MLAVLNLLAAHSLPSQSPPSAVAEVSRTHGQPDQHSFVAPLVLPAPKIPGRPLAAKCLQNFTKTPGPVVFPIQILRAHYTQISRHLSAA